MKNALVTGGTKGIGWAITRMLLNEGYAVTATYAHDDDVAEKCRQSLMYSQNVEFIRVDQTSTTEIHRLSLELCNKKHIDCIICNAGITLRKGLSETKDSEWEKVMQTNVNNNLYLIRDLLGVIPHDSRIVFVSSLMGILPHGTSLAYGVSKAAIIALAKNLVKVFEATGTTVNVIAPGFVETDWQQNKPEIIRHNICEKTALKRFATPDEIADSVRFCINNAFVNGSVIEVSGGYDFK